MENENRPVRDTLVPPGSLRDRLEQQTRLSVVGGGHVEDKVDPYLLVIAGFIIFSIICNTAYTAIATLLAPYVDRFLPW